MARAGGGAEAPWRGLVPALAPLGGRRPWAIVSLLLAVSAALALWPLPLEVTSALPAGDGDALSRWTVVLERGHDWRDLVQVDRTNHPLGEDLVARHGVPLEAGLAAPLLRAVDWPLGVNLALWWLVWLGGLSAAWFAGRWWGHHGAALAAGVGWQTGATLATAASEGAYPVLLALALLPLAVGLWIRALERGTWAAGVLAGAPVVALVIEPREAGWWWVLAALPPLGIALMAGRWSACARAGAGVLGAIVMIGLAPLAWAIASGWLAAAPPSLTPSWAGPAGLLVAALAAVGLMHAHGVPRRWVLPACWTGLGALVALGTWGDRAPGTLFEQLPGAGSAGGVFAVAELGLLLLVGGLAAWRRDGALVAIAVLLAAGPMRPVQLVDWPPELAAGEGALLELPMPTRSTDALVRAAAHQRPLASGRGHLDPVTVSLHRLAPVLDELERLDEAAGRAPSSAELSQLRRLGVRHLAIDLERAGPWLPELERRLGPGERGVRWLVLPLPELAP